MLRSEAGVKAIEALLRKVEPDSCEHGVAAETLLASIAQSAKRIADSLDRLSTSRRF